jgi:hypothetical protein
MDECDATEKTGEQIMTKPRAQGVRLVLVTVCTSVLLLGASVSIANTESAQNVAAQAPEMTQASELTDSAAGDKQSDASANTKESAGTAEKKSVHESPYIKYARERAAKEDLKPEHAPNLSIVVGKPGAGRHQQH